MISKVSVRSYCFLQDEQGTLSMSTTETPCHYFTSVTLSLLINYSKQNNN